MMVTPADRVTALEIRYSEQEKTIDDLSGQIAEQWTAIERLQRSLARMGERFMALEERVAPDVPITKPPHW